MRRCTWAPPAALGDAMSSSPRPSTLVMTPIRVTSRGTQSGPPREALDLLLDAEAPPPPPVEAASVRAAPPPPPASPPPRDLARAQTWSPPGSARWVTSLYQAATALGSQLGLAEDPLIR